MIASRKALAAGIAALALAAPITMHSSPAAAWWRHGWGGPAAVGLIGGLAAGTIIGNALAAPPAYAPTPVYMAPPPPYPYYPCWRRVWGPWGWHWGNFC